MVEYDLEYADRDSGFDASRRAGMTVDITGNRPFCYSALRSISFAMTGK